MTEAQILDDIVKRLETNESVAWDELDAQDIAVEFKAMKDFITEERKKIKPVFSCC